MLDFGRHFGEGSITPVFHATKISFSALAGCKTPQAQNCLVSKGKAKTETWPLKKTGFNE